MPLPWREQFSTGDQTRESRKAFCDLRFKRCVKCSSNKIKEERFLAGVRPNGDAVGTDVFTCEACGWHTSFQFDDSAEAAYYETMGWWKEVK